LFKMTHLLAANAQVQNMVENLAIYPA
jgi:hypothetical protein